MINEYHLLYITNNVMLSFIRENKIKVPNCSYTAQNLANVINDYATKSTQNTNLVKSKINEWMTQGRKKVLFRYFNDELCFDRNQTDNWRSCIYELFIVENTDGLNDIKLSSDKIRCLVNLECIADNNVLKSIKFTFVEKVKQRIKDTEVYKEIPLPVFIEINLELLEIIARVCVKSDLYRISGEKIEEIKVAQEILEDVLGKLRIDTSISAVQKAELQRIIYSIHNEITDLPEEIVAKADSINEEINCFIDVIAEKIELIDDETNKEEIGLGIKNVILKHIISMYDDKKIFEEGKYAISTGLDGSGLSMSKFQFHAPASEPVQSNPEYQNIRNMLEDAEKIKKDVILWNSNVIPDIKIRMKMYVHQDGYIQICFEQYVYEEDIQNVLSKIREFK
ncbi:hypothetical protein [Clostridium butyricum]|uniref:hypothetical protein n=1 Tax=Clostridium butyricum TaxID=1492 RepID=UPI0012B99252|nr:hypothetical protein [Clostridium butyricum]